MTTRTKAGWLFIAAALLIMKWSKGGEKSGSSGLLTGAAWTLVAIGILLPGIMMAGFGVIPTMSAGDKQPLLLVSGRQGSGGVPDMAVTYWTENPRADTFNWGETSTDRVIKESNATSSHVFMMRDLRPGGTYSYRINGGRPVTFRAPPVTGKLHFAVSSDPHYGANASRNDLTEKMLAEIAKPSNDFDMFFTLGDQVQLGFLDENWRKDLVDSPWPSKQLEEVLGDPSTTLRACIQEYLFVSLFRVCTESLAS